MSTPARIPRIILGPNELGRDYDLLAISEGLNVSGYVPLLRRFISDISTFVGPDWPVQAFFPLGDPARDPWYLSTTTLNAEAGGNPMRMTSGLVLDVSTLEALDWRAASLLEPWYGPPPPRGTLVEPRPLPDRLPPPIPAGKLGLNAAIRLGNGEHVAVVVGDDVDPGPTLISILDALQDIRPEIPFITMPPVRPANLDFALTLYPASVAARLRDPVRARILTPDNLEEVSAPARTWHGFVEAVSLADPAVSRLLNRHTRQIAASPAAYGNRIVGALNPREISSDLRRRKAFRVMLKAASGLVDVGLMARSHLFVGLAAGLQSCLEASDDRRGWFIDYSGWRNDADLSALDPTMAGLAANSAELFTNVEVAAAIGPLTCRHAPAAFAQAVRQTTPSPPHARALLTAVCSVLEQGGDEALWEAGARLFDVLGKESTEASPSWIQLAVVRGRWPELLRSSDTAGRTAVEVIDSETWIELGRVVVTAGHQALDQAAKERDETARNRLGLIALGAHLLAQVHPEPLG